MIWIAVQFVDLLFNEKLTLLLLVWTLGFLNYLIFVYYFSKYKPVKNDFRVPVTVVMPVFREKPELLTRSLESIKKQIKNGDEFFVVFDGEDKPLQSIADKYGTVMVKPHGGKRSTLSYGCDRASNPVVVTIDSDTVLCPDCLDAMVMPFKDAKIGAVSAYQRIFNADMNIASKFADYNELMACGFMQKATSAAGNVPVLYGRCLAIRKIVWDRISYKYQNKLFRGRKVESGDDNDITILTIQEGYRTFMQSSAKVTSDCPREFWSRLRQQYRFNRSSIRVTIADWFTNLRLINSAKLGFLNQITAIVFPFLILGVWIEWIEHTAFGYYTIIQLAAPLAVIATVFTLSSTLAVHNLPLLEKKRDLPVWILYIFYSWAVMNLLNILSVLTIFKEQPHLIQYSRNE